jgi:hypothetical protein
MADGAGLRVEGRGARAGEYVGVGVGVSVSVVDVF